MTLSEQIDYLSSKYNIKRKRVVNKKPDEKQFVKKEIVLSDDLLAESNVYLNYKNNKLRVD